MAHREARSEADFGRNCRKLAALGISECGLAKYYMSLFSLFVSGEVMFGRPVAPPEPQVSSPKRVDPLIEDKPAQRPLPPALPRRKIVSRVRALPQHTADCRVHGSIEADNGSNSQGLRRRVGGARMQREGGHAPAAERARVRRGAVLSACDELLCPAGHVPTPPARAGARDGGVPPFGA
eukprot:gene3575-biopygen8231